ncbi:MAG: outer membrane protein assembly factor BamA [Idiomarina sp.]|nr:outer membrane protein assembly factor BamA [Idiomarina sp.]
MTLRKFLFGAVLLGAGSSVAAAESFVVDDIQIRGLQRVAVGAALTYIPVRVGDEVDSGAVRQLIRELYSSTHFDDIRVRREGNSLFIHVVERPVISEITFEGNRDIKDEQLEDSLRNNGLAVGESLDRTVLQGLAKSIEDFYHSVGKYNARVEVRTINLPRNRVELRFDFVEGAAAEIVQINVIGNSAFSRQDLVDQMELSDHVPWWNPFKRRQYQQQQLQGDIESLESFYMNQGYLRYGLESVQVAITPELERIYVTLNVNEGEQYTINTATVGGDLRQHREFLAEWISYFNGRRYNQAEVTSFEEGIKSYFGRFGYARTEVRAVPEIDDENKTVDLTFMVNPGQRIYVRRVNFVGNDATSDEVLRREMRQMEGAWLSEQQVELGKNRLERLGFFETVEVQTIPVAGQEDQVDIVYNVKEQPSGSIQAGVGYGDFAGLSLNAAIAQENFLGSGNSVSFQVDTNRYSRNFQVNYRDNYFTDDGVSLGGSVYYNDFDGSRANLQDFNQTTWGISTDLGFPINEFNRLNFGVGYASTDITQFNQFDQIRAFYQRYANPDRPNAALNFETFTLSAGWSRVTLNRGVFPTAGSSNRLVGKITTPNSDLQYFRLDYRFRYYQPFDRDHEWVGLFRFTAGYGNGYGRDGDFEYTLPFWENFYGGGADSLRGFEPNRAGPRGLIRRPQFVQGPPDREGRPTQIALGPENDVLDVLGRSAIGGNATANASLELIFPTPFAGAEARNSVRTSAFVDISSVWDTEFDFERYRNLTRGNDTPFWDYSDPKNFQASYGVSLQWLSPMGALTFSLGFPLKSLDSEMEDRFTFNIGTTF